MSKHFKTGSLIVLVLLGFSALSIPLAFIPSAHATLVYVQNPDISVVAPEAYAYRDQPASPSRNVFYFSSFNYYVCFYLDGIDNNVTNYYRYKFSDTGETWDNETFLDLTPTGLTSTATLGGPQSCRGTTFSGWADSSHIYLAFLINYDFNGTYEFFEWYGTPHSDKTISWIITPILRTAPNGGVTTFQFTANTNGYPLLIYSYGVGANSPWTYYTALIVSDRNDGVWHTKSGFPTIISAGSDVQCEVLSETGHMYSTIWIYPWYVAEQPLANGAVYLLYSAMGGGGHNQSTYGRIWYQANSTLSVEETIWDGTPTYRGWGNYTYYIGGVLWQLPIAAIGNDVFYIYGTTHGGYIQKRTYANSSWSTPQNVFPFPEVGPDYTFSYSLTSSSSRNLVSLYYTYDNVTYPPPFYFESSVETFALKHLYSSNMSISRPEVILFQSNSTHKLVGETVANSIAEDRQYTSIDGSIKNQEMATFRTQRSGDEGPYYLNMTLLSFGLHETIPSLPHYTYLPSAAPLEIYYNYTNFIYTEGYPMGFLPNVFRTDLFYRITVLNNTGLGLIRGDVKVLTNVILNVTALTTTTNAEIYLGLRYSPNGSLLYKWNLAFNTTIAQNYVLNITLPKPIISDQVILEMNTTVFEVSVGPTSTRYPVYNYYGVDQGWSATVAVQYFDFEPLVYHKYAHSHFTVWSDSPYLTTDDQLSFKYLDKPPSMFYVLNVTGYLPFNVTSNYIVYSPDTTHHYIPLPFNYFYNVGQAFLTLSGNTTYAVTPYDENTFKPISANAWLRVDNMNETRYLIYQTTNTTGLTYVYGNLGGAHRTLPWAKIAKIYFPYNETFYAYTFTVDFGHTYRVYDMFGTLLDLGNVSSPTKAFTTSLQYGKTYRLIIDGTHTFDIGADANTMRMLYNYVFPVYDRGDIAFEATRTLTWATVHFRDASRNGSVVLTAYSNEGGSLHQFSTITLPSGTFDWSFDVDPNQDYIVKADYTAGSYGSYDVTIPIQTTSVNDLSGLMGNMQIGSVTVSISSFLFTTVMFGVFALFSQDNAELGIIVGILLSFFLSWFNLISWTSSIANLCYGLLLVAVFELMAKKETGG